MDRWKFVGRQIVVGSLIGWFLATVIGVFLYEQESRTLTPPRPPSIGAAVGLGALISSGVCAAVALFSLAGSQIGGGRTVHRLGSLGQRIGGRGGTTDGLPEGALTMFALAVIVTVELLVAGLSLRTLTPKPFPQSHPLTAVADDR